MSETDPDELKDLGDETLNSILEELVEMRNYQRERQKDAEEERRAGRLEDRTERIRHSSAADAIQRAINTVVEHGQEPR